MGCATRPAGRWTVDTLKISGAVAVAQDEVSEKLATRENTSFVGVPTTYEVYDPFVVQRDVQRIERFYRARGHFDARVRSVRVIRMEPGEVVVRFEVDEGPATKVSLVRVQRLTPLEPVAEQAVAKAASIAPGDSFEEARYEGMKQAITRALTDNGYAHGHVDGGFRTSDLAPLNGVRVLDAGSDEFRTVAPAAEAPGADGAEDDPTPRPVDRGGPGRGRLRRGQRFGVRVDPSHRREGPPAPDGARGPTTGPEPARAEVYLQITSGPICAFGTVTLVGFGDLPEAKIRRLIAVSSGSRYSQAALDSARAALLELGLFSTVEFAEDRPDDNGSVVPVTFRVTRTPLRTLTLGGGGQADVLRTDVHFVAGYEHQNFLGGLRRLTMQVKPGLVLFPTNLQNLLPPQRVLPEVKSKAELRQPSFLEARLNGTLRSEFLIYPLTLPARSAPEVPDVVVGYREIRQAAGLDRTFLRGKLGLAAFYNFQVSFPFSYFGALDQGIRRLILSYVSLTQTVDLRNDPVRPRRGAFFGNEIQVAGIGGDARDVRFQPEARFYAPISKRLTLATRAGVGFLFPFSYGGSLGEEPGQDALASRAFASQRNRDLQILYFRGLFSGGPSSNRGYVIRGVGPRGVAPFHIGGATTQRRDCVGRAPGGSGVPGTSAQVAAIAPIDPNICGVPLGGLSSWESSVEVRAMITELFSLSFFLDASDVTRDRLTLRLDYPHLSTGTGFRYDTPVGPVRLDVGYALPGAQHVGGTLDPATEGQPASFLGVPVAVSIAVGEAF